jgi:broad-specificity NMP kinase
MGIRNYLIEGVSGTGKTSVARELERRGHAVVHGDNELAYYGDPRTGETLDELGLARVREDILFGQRHWIWDVRKVEALVADHRFERLFFCGGSRNFSRFIGLFDRVFVLDVDAGTLERRLRTRGDDEFGGRAEERALVLRLQATREDIPKGDVVIDATMPIAHVVDEILARC